MAIYVNEAFDSEVPGLPPTTPCAVDACWTVAGEPIVFHRDGIHTALVFAPTVADGAALASSLVVRP